MERIDEARRVFDDAVEEMDEGQERKHRESLNESTELLFFCRLGKIDKTEAHKAEEGEGKQGGG